jgi:hypothetical protein
VKRLFAQIPFPGFEVEESTFGVDEIWQYIKKNEAALRYSSREDFISVRGECYVEESCQLSYIKYSTR